MPAADAPPPPDYEYVDTPEGLERVARAVAAAGAAAVDTEADSMHSFFEKVCLVQIATDSGDAFLVDPLALDGMKPLAASFADASITKIFHGADFDVSSLRRDFEYDFAGVFDTMVASQFLGDEKLSLRDVVERFFGVRLDKSYTRTDWGRRPLSEEQLAYCYNDVAYLVPLMEIQQQRLEEADLVEEAGIEFARLALREPNRSGPSDDEWSRVKGARRLSPAEQSVLAEIYKVRHRHGRKQDRPVFKVIGNDTLLRIARAMPEDATALRRVKGVSAYAGGRMARELVAAVAKGRARGTPPVPPRRKTDPVRRLDQTGQKRLGRLRDWRNAAAESSGRTTLAVLPNYAMFEVARLRPRTIEALARIEGVGEKRSREWGEDILAQLG